jgi:hypothetical protein
LTSIDNAIGQAKRVSEVFRGDVAMIRHGWPIPGVRLVFGVLALLAGCDRSPDAPRITHSSTPEPTVATASAPTTQELLNGSYKKISLAPLPLSAQVPQSWECTVPEGTHMTVLKGPLLDGSNLHISLEMGAKVPGKIMDSILAGAKKDAAREKLTTILCDVRTLGDLKVLEEQKRFHPADTPAESLIEWKTTYFVPREGDFSPFTLDIISMTDAQFEQSRVLIRKIIDSIVYDPTATTF